MRQKQDIDKYNLRLRINTVFNIYYKFAPSSEDNLFVIETHVKVNKISLVFLKNFFCCSDYTF